MDAPVVAAAVAEMARGEDLPSTLLARARGLPAPPSPPGRPHDPRAGSSRPRGPRPRDGSGVVGVRRRRPRPRARGRVQPRPRPRRDTTSPPRRPPRRSHRPQPRDDIPIRVRVRVPVPSFPPLGFRGLAARAGGAATHLPHPNVDAVVPLGGRLARPVDAPDVVAWTFATRAVSCAVLAAAAARLVHPMRVHVSPHAARIFVALVVVALIGLVHVAVVAHRVDAVVTRASPETHFEIRADSRRVKTWGCEETAAWLDAEVGAWAAERAVETFCDLGVFAAELMEADDAMLRVELGVASRSRRRAVSVAAEKLRRQRDEHGEERAKVWIATRGRDERGKEKEEGSKEGSKEGSDARVRRGSEGSEGSEPFLTAREPFLTAREPSLSAPEPSSLRPEPSFTAREPSLSAREPSLSAPEPSSLPSSESTPPPIRVVSLSAWRASSPASRSADILGVTNCPRLRVLRDALLGDGALLDLAGLTRPPTHSNQTRPRVNPRAFALWMVWPGACAALRAHELWGLDAPAGAWGVAMGFALVAMWCQGAIELALRWRDGGGVGDARDPRSAASSPRTGASTPASRARSSWNWSASRSGSRPRG